MTASLQAQIIHVPGDYPTIQQAIDTADIGDTVLVSPGTYVENINFTGKNITVASLFLTTQDTSYISQTIIDGNQAGSVVMIWGVDSTAVLTGFTITNGNSSNGGGICTGIFFGRHPIGGSPTLRDLKVINNVATTGGGVCAPFGGRPSLFNVTVSGNTAETGGGLCCFSDGHASGYRTAFNLRNVEVTNNIAGQIGGGLYLNSIYDLINEFRNVRISYNSTSGEGGGIYFACGNEDVYFDSIYRCSIYLNRAAVGNDLFYPFPPSSTIFQVKVDTFTVLDPTEFHASPLSRFSFDILHGKTEQVEADLFVSPDGDDNNSGLTPIDPLKTIHLAFSKILADPLNPHTINLLEGTYSSTLTGEFFPVTPPEFVSLKGVSNTITVLDAGGSSTVLKIINNDSTSISGMTIRGGNATAGGGVYCENSNVTLEDLVISDNTSEDGGGIYCKSSSMNFLNMIVCNNSSRWGGGGISFDYGLDASLGNVTVCYNSARFGGGIFSYSDNIHFDSLNRCNIFLNTAMEGNDFWGNGQPIIVDTFTVMNPNEFHAAGLVSFDILHGKLEQVDDDLYVSPAGDNTHSGISPVEPLKTIHHALLKIRADSLHQNTIHLLEGIYSPSATGDLFPVNIPDYVSLAGTAKEAVVVDAQGTGGVINMDRNMFNNLSGMTITGGNGYGIYCDYSNPVLENMAITQNPGSGLHCLASSPFLENVIISGNTASEGGGIYCQYNSNPSLQNVIITSNSAVTGGGLYCSASPALHNVKITNNSAQNEGGGIYSSNSSPILANVTIAYNTAGSRGGGILVNGGTYAIFDTIYRSNIYLNTAPDGNDLSGDPYSGMILKVVVDTFTVRYPTSVHASQLANFTFDILNGKLEQVDDDLYVSPSGDNTNSGLTQSDPLMTIHHALLKISPDTLHQNTIHLLKGIYGPSANGEIFPVYLPGYINLKGVGDSIVVIDADSVAGVVVINNSPASTLEGVTLTGGFSEYGGGGLSVANSNVMLNHMTIKENWGSGINSSEYNNLTLQDVDILNNSGGGLFSSYSGLILEDVRIMNNLEGGLYCYESDPFLFNVKISGNTGAMDGGGIHCSQSNAYCENVTISDNMADSRGGGFVGFHSSLTLKNGLISGNSAPYGGGFYFASFSGLKSILTNVTISDNTCSYSYYEGGSGLQLYNSEVQITNSIVWNNQPHGILFDIYSENNVLTVLNSDIQGGQDSVVTNNNGTVNWLEGNIDEDPLFAENGMFPFMLTTGSPCRNAGTPDTTGLFLPLTDLAGGPRIWEDRIDMGAYEWSNVGTEELQFTICDLRFTIFPNPFRESTNFSYTLKERSRVTVQIFNSFGRMVATPVNSFRQKGEQLIEWDAGDLPAGIYFCRIRAGSQTGSGKMVKN
jgi:hypothetical protein